MVLRPSTEPDTLLLPLLGDIGIRFGPDGVLPMWNSEHPGIQGLFVHTHYETGLYTPFVPLADAFLR